MGRPQAEAPRGWVTIREAAERRGTTDRVVRRRIKDGLVRAEQTDNGVWVVREADLERIVQVEPTPAAERDRVRFWLAPSSARHAEWERAAKGRGMTVSELAYWLLDREAGR